MKECVTLIGVVRNEHNVNMCALLGDLIFLKESFKLSYEHAPKQVQEVLQNSYVYLSAPQLVIDDSVVRTSKRFLDCMSFTEFISAEYGEHCLAAESPLYASYIKQLDDFLKEAYEVEKDVSTR